MFPIENTPFRILRYKISHTILSLIELEFNSQSKYDLMIQNAVV